MEKIYILGTLVFLTVIMTMLPVQTQVASPQVQGLLYNSEVCVYKNNELIECSHNLLTSYGKNWTRDLIGNWGGGSNAMQYIGIANSSTGCVDANSLNGLTPAASVDAATNPVAGTYAVNPVSDGNWTISKVFIAQETIDDVNATGLYNTTTEVLMFACNNFTAVDLQASDQINVTWTIWVT